MRSEYNNCTSREFRDIYRSIVSESDSIIKVMQVINEGAVQIGLILGANNRLDGLVTDGDIRRALVGGATLSDPVHKFVQRDFRSVGIGTNRSQALDLMKAFNIQHLPILDDQGRLVGLHLLERLIKTEVVHNPALILAGGKGTRLGELTRNTPKPMIKVAGRPILERLVLHLVGSGVRRIFFSVNHLADVIKDHFSDGEDYGCEITYLEEDEPLGTGGCLALLEPFQIKHPLIVMNGDLVTDFSVAGMLKAHRRERNVITVGVKEYTHRIPFGCLELDGAKVRSIREKPVHVATINAGIYVINPDQFAGRTPEFFPITNYVEMALERGESVGAFQVDDWIDVGVPAELAKAQGQ